MKLIKVYISVACIILIIASGQAQRLDSLSASTTDSLHYQVKLDSLGKDRSLALPDSLNLANKFKGKLTKYSSDSLLGGKSFDLKDRQKGLLSAKDSLDLSDKIPNVDSSGFVQKLKSVSEFQDNAVDSLQQAIKSKVKNLQKPKAEDSLLSKFPTDKLNKKIDDPLNELNEKSKALTKIEGLDQSKITTVTDKLSSESGLDTGGIDKVGNISQSLPSTEIVDSKLPGVSGVDLKGQEVTDKLPNVRSVDGLTDQVDIGNLGESVEGLTKEIDLPKIDQLSEVDDLTEKAKLPDTPRLEELKIDELGRAKEYSGELSGIKDKAGELKDINANQLKDEEIKKKAEDQLKNVNGVGEVEENVKAFEETRELPDRYKKQMEQYQGKEKLKKEIRSKYMQFGNQHFVGKSKELKASKESLEKYKKKYDDIEPVDGIVNRKRNAMKEKPFRERFLMGGYVQIQGSPRTMLDISPQVGYRLSGLFSVGAGVTYRFYFSSDELGLAYDDKVFGARTYLNAEVYKGFYLHGEFESMSTFVSNINTSGQEVGERQWVNGVLLGIGKSYSITRNIKGFAQVLHNFTYEFGESPYRKKLMFRFGVEGMLGKKSKRKN